MAERGRFELPIALRLCLISSQVHSTGLCHLSVLSTTIDRALSTRFLWHCQLHGQFSLFPTGLINAANRPSPTVKTLHSGRARETCELLAHEAAIGTPRPWVNPIRLHSVYWRRCISCNAKSIRSRKPALRTVSRSRLRGWTGKVQRSFSLSGVILF